MSELAMDELKYEVLDEIDALANLVDSDVHELTPSQTKALKGHLKAARKQLSELNAKLSKAYTDD